MVEVGLPVKQGLKLIAIYLWASIRKVEVGLPVKQGLKQVDREIYSISFDGVEVGLPVKQGLKLATIF